MSCHSERGEESPPFVERKGARGMLTFQQLAVHPPLTSLRSFAPPYASEGGLVALRLRMGVPPWRFLAALGMTWDARNLPPSWNVRGLGGCSE